MEEAYKMLSGAPAGDGVSRAAKGQMPEQDLQEREDFQEEKVARQFGEPKMNSSDLEKAYAMLFESLAMITRSRS